MASGWYCISWDETPPHWIIDEVEVQFVNGKIVGYKELATKKHRWIGIHSDRAETYGGPGAGYLIFHGTYEHED